MPPKRKKICIFLWLKADTIKQPFESLIRCDTEGAFLSLQIPGCASTFWEAASQQTAASLLSVCLSVYKQAEHGWIRGMNCFLTSRQKPKLKPSMKAKGKSTQYWSNFSIFFIVKGNYSHAVGNGILVESCWLLELAFSECRPRKLKEG